MREFKTVTCKECKELKIAFLSDRSKAKKERKWEDEHGKFFNGKVCPDCHRSKMKVRQNEYNRKKVVV